MPSGEAADAPARLADAAPDGDADNAKEVAPALGASSRGISTKRLRLALLALRGRLDEGEADAARAGDAAGTSVTAASGRAGERPAATDRASATSSTARWSWGDWATALAAACAPSGAASATTTRGTSFSCAPPACWPWWW